MDIFQNVEALHLPPNQYVVFGSGPLEAYGIRPTRDVDLFVTSVLYQELKVAGWEEKTWDLMPGKYLAKDGLYEADDTWHYGDYDPTPEEIIAVADIIRGVPFAPIIEVLKWKRAFGRPKDLADIALIEQYLAGHK
jgi:hypothetical protein